MYKNSDEDFDFPKAVIFNTGLLREVQNRRKESQVRLNDFFASTSGGRVNNTDIGQISPVHSPLNNHQETEI